MKEEEKIKAEKEQQGEQKEKHKNHKHHHDHHCDCDHDHNEDHCDCHEEGCDCDHEYNAEDEAFKMYEKAFRQLEEALIKADKDLQAEKKRADENEHIARAFRQDMDRLKERNKTAEAEFKVNANKDVALKIIPILDNFDQALEKVTDEATKKGFEMIYNKLSAVLSELGVIEIEADGKEFDPELHDCITKSPAPNKKEAGKVAKIYQKGYKFNGEDGKVIRHAVVEIYE